MVIIHAKHISVFYRQIKKQKGVERMSRLMIFILISLLLAGCAVNPSKPQPQDKIDSPTSSLKLNLNDYFPQENKTFSFRGEGNEFASYKEDFFQLTDNYLTSIVENGGTRIFKVYQLTNDGIYLVYEQPEYYEEAPLEVEALKNQFKPVPLLKAPLEIGNKYNDISILKINEELTLPIGQLTNVIVTEQRDDDQHTILKKYWAPGYGLVKTEFISTEPEEMIVTSELESIQ